VTQILKLGPVYNIDHYISPLDDATYKGKPNTIPVAVVSIDEDREAGFQTAEILRNHPDASFHVIIATASQDASLILSILREGKYGFLSLPATANQVLAELKKITPASATTVETKKDGKVFLFAGTNGGAGTTTVAVNTAVALAEGGKKTILIDHHRILGHVALYLGLPNSTRSIYDVLANDERMDDSLFGTYVVQHSSGLDVLCSPDVLGAAQKEIEKPETFKRVVTFLRNRYEFILFDSFAGDIETGIVAAEADMVFFVVSAEVAPIRDLTQYVTFYGKGDNKIQVIVNHEGRSAITAQEVADHVGIPVVTSFAEVNGSVSTAVNAGMPVPAEVRGFHEPLTTLLDLIDPREFKEEEPKKKSWIPIPWGRK
jgi:pilus assembly protein CpaE